MRPARRPLNERGASKLRRQKSTLATPLYRPPKAGGRDSIDIIMMAPGPLDALPALLDIVATDASAAALSEAPSEEPMTLKIIAARVRIEFYPSAPAMAVDVRKMLLNAQDHYATRAPDLARRAVALLRRFENALAQEEGLFVDPAAEEPISALRAERLAAWRPPRDLDEIDDDPADEAPAAAPGWVWVEMPAPTAAAPAPAVIYAAAAPAPRKKPVREEAMHPARKAADAATYQFDSDDSAGEDAPAAKEPAAAGEDVPPAPAVAKEPAADAPATTPAKQPADAPATQFRRDEAGSLEEVPLRTASPRPREAPADEITADELASYFTPPDEAPPPAPPRPLRHGPPVAIPNHLLAADREPSRAEELPAAAASPPRAAPAAPAGARGPAPPQATPRYNPGPPVPVPYHVLAQGGDRRRKALAATARAARRREAEADPWGLFALVERRGWAHAGALHAVHSARAQAYARGDSFQSLRGITARGFRVQAKTTTARATEAEVANSLFESLAATGELDWGRLSVEKPDLAPSREDLERFDSAARRLGLDVTKPAKTPR